jgi:hypothetical protein
MFPIQWESFRIFALKILQDQGLALGHAYTSHQEASANHEPDRNISPDHDPSLHTPTPFGFHHLRKRYCGTVETWFVLFIWFIWLVSFNQTNEIDQTNQITVFFRWRTFSASC